MVRDALDVRGPYALGPDAPDAHGAVRYVGTMTPKYPAGPRMKSRVMKRSTLVDGHKTSVTLEDEFWTALKEIATTQNVGTPKLISMIDSQRQNNNLSSAIRVCVLGYYRERCDAKDLGNKHARR